MNLLSVRPHARSLVAALLFGCGGVAATASPAVAATTTQSQTVTGVTVATLALTLGTPAVLTGLSPGSTATGTGTVTIVDTGPWTLSVNDSSSTSSTGHPTAAATGCTGSQAALTNPLTVSTTALLGTVTPGAPVSLTGTAQTVATGTSSAEVTTNYSDPILSTEPLITGCVYGLTTVYTLQG